MAQSNGIDAENGNTNGNGLVSVVSEESRPPGRVRSVSYWSLPHKVWMDGAHSPLLLSKLSSSSGFHSARQKHERAHSD